MFNAIYLTQENKKTLAELKQLDEAALPAGDVDVRVEYSTINFKDALAICRSGVVRSWRTSGRVTGASSYGIDTISMGWSSADAMISIVWANVNAGASAALKICPADASG